MSEEEDTKYYIEMARLAQEAFNERRRFEWRVNFSLWAALGLVAYACKTEKIEVFSNPIYGWVFGGGVFVCYFIYQWMVSQANESDKRWKHYYLNKAEKRTDIPRPTPVEKTPIRFRILWCVGQLGFTAAILFLVLMVLMR